MRWLLAVLLLLAVPAWADMYPDASNAKMPEARNNLLNTPTSCDGRSNSDGQVFVGSNLLYSPAAPFTENMVGKLATVAGAGPNQHVDVVTIAGGGAGYAVHDRITLAGGTGTPVQLRVRAVSAGVITEIGPSVVGSYSAVPSGTIAQASTTGSGTGATFTATWLRDALVTTITGQNSNTQLVMAANSAVTATGVYWGVGSDYAAQINAALAQGPVQLPPGKCGIASPVNLDFYSRLAGATRGRTELMWLGPNQGGPVLNSGDSPYINGITDGVLSDFTVNGLGSAHTCLYLHGMTSWRIEQVTALNCVGVAADFDSSTVGSAGGFINNTISGLFLQAANSSASAVPMKIGPGNPMQNFGYNRFTDLRIQFTNGTGFECGYSDNNMYFGIWIFRFAGGIGDAMEFQGDVGVASCQGDVFHGASIEGGYIRARGGTIPSRDNKIYDTGTLLVAVTPPANLRCTQRDGGSAQCTPHEFTTVTPANPAGISDTAAYRMYGLAGSFLPKYSGRMLIQVSGTVSNTSAGGGGNLGLRVNVGAPPANGAADTPSACGNSPALRNSPSATFAVPFTLTCLIPGGGGVTYWFDVAGKALTSGTLNIGDLAMTVSEQP